MSALSKFSKDATRRYLQSVVFVDDNIFNQKTGMPELPVDMPPKRKLVYRRSGTPSTPSNASAAPDEIDTVEPLYHPKDLVSSFAKEGITCALYEPSEGFGTNPESEMFKLCERPDIIILDWDFWNDKGAKALDLISALVKQSTSDFPHHTRLISIYTADQSLLAVANSIADRLKKDGLEATPIEVSYRLQSKATRLVILGKPKARFGEEEVRFTVKESNLAATLIDEFVKMNAGILPSYALHGLAAIRNNSKRILDRFHGDLDGAFLLHRELVSKSEEAFDQLPELLAEEMRAVVEDESLSAGYAKKLAAAALKHSHILPKDKEWIVSSKQGMRSDRVAHKIRETGSVPIGHLRLAALFSSRTQYSSALRRLTFGTVVRFRAKYSKAKKTPWQYAVCLVPECDSLRLQKTTQLPFWTIEREAYKDGARRNGMVLALGKDCVSLSASGKAGDKLWTDSFAVDSKTNTIVAVRKAGVYKYLGAKRNIEWYGQLKPLHAHRIAHEITDALSRIGVSEAEWLRLLCDR
ncbi:MAG TPA: response regulator receiver domain [Elusimicrobiales bacterium]|nr:response regulator receiver domain [Elusimicrobiales bacterium]